MREVSLEQAPPHIKAAVEVLNHALGLHRAELSQLFDQTVKVPLLADHPNTVVMENNELGPLGLINGILASPDFLVFREVSTVLDGHPLGEGTILRFGVMAVK